MKRFQIVVIFSLLVGIHSECPNLCNKKGLCDKYNKCHCSEGFEGGDCSLRKCPKGVAWADQAVGVDDSHKLATCSNRGVCDTSFGTCSCLQGFTGSACERLDCDNSCGGNGRCLSMQDRATKFRDSNSQSYIYANVWDAQKITGCVCDNGFYDYQCIEQSCPEGDDPLTTPQVNEIQLIKCVASLGKFLLYYDGMPSTWIPYSADTATVKAALESIPEITDVTVTFSQSTSSVCNPIANVVSIEFTKQFGSLSPLVPLLDTEMVSTGGQVFVSADGTTSFADFISGDTYKSQKGTKESDVCSFRGTCSSTGVCSCFNTNGDAYGSSDGYGSAGSLGDCGYVQSGLTVSTCPGELECSTHGVCHDTTFRCECSDGWTAGDCSIRTCPYGRSWFDYPISNNDAHETFTECSDMGTCDTVTGLCGCRSNFFGDACQYMNCDAGGGGSAGQSQCTGNGQCLSVAELAIRAKNNGDPATYTYGTDPNNALTWDGNRIFGCLCDDGWEGYDCSLRSCPKGDDLGTYDDHAEVQLLQCIANNGYFRLHFREVSTGPIYANSTSDQVQLALTQALQGSPTRVYFTQDGDVPLGVLTPIKPRHPFPVNAMSPAANTVVTVNTPTTAACDVLGNQTMIVHFIGTHGDLPALRADISQLIDTFSTVGFLGSGVINIFHDGESISGLTSIRGNTENAVCNNRGICDQLTGVCECFSQWASSDGAGNLGDRGDCGALIIT